MDEQEKEEHNKFAKQYWEETGATMVKCPGCGWVHFISDDPRSGNNCFLCSKPARFMVPAGHKDCPVGCTLQPVNRQNFKGEKCTQTATASQ